MIDKFPVSYSLKELKWERGKDGLTVGGLPHRDHPATVFVVSTSEGVFARRDRGPELDGYFALSHVPPQALRGCFIGFSERRDVDEWYYIEILGRNPNGQATAVAIYSATRGHSKRYPSGQGTLEIGPPIVQELTGASPRNFKFSPTLRHIIESLHIAPN